MSEEKVIDSLESLSEKMAEDEMKKAFRYYNYVREFYGYLFDSLDLIFEEDCYDFDPAYAPRRKRIPSR